MADWPNELITSLPIELTPDTSSAITPIVFEDSAIECDSNTIDVTLVHAVVGTLTAVVDGVFQAGYAGTITDVGRDVEVAITTHPSLWPGTWTVNVYAETYSGATLTDSWSFEMGQEPSFVPGTSRTIARRVVELVFEYPVIVRETAETNPEPTDNYTPIVWTGDAWHAANPANYSMVRSGTLDGPGEAVDPIVVHVEESEEYGADHTLNGTLYRTSTRLAVTVDYQWTPRADHLLTAIDLQTHPLGTGLVTANTISFSGYVVSQVVRQSLHLIDTLPKRIVQDDLEGTGDLTKFYTAIQEVFDRLTEDVDVFFTELCSIDLMRPEFLDALLYDLGDPFREKLGLTTAEKRKLATLLVDMYRQKGTCQGLINAVRVFTGLTMVGCRAPWDDVWELAGGAYPAPVGGDELGIGTFLGPTGASLWKFWLLHAAPGAITAAQLARIAIVVEYMKPASSHYLGVEAP